MMLEKVVKEENNFSLDTKAKPTTISHEGWPYKGMLKQRYYDTEKKIEVILCYACMYIPSLDRYEWAKRP